MTLRTALQNSVSAARLGAVHDLSATIHYAGQTLADTAVRIQEAWVRDEMPSPHLVASVRRSLQAAQDALSEYDRVPVAPVFDHDDDAE